MATSNQDREQHINEGLRKVRPVHVCRSFEDSGWQTGIVNVSLAELNQLTAHSRNRAGMVSTKFCVALAHSGRNEQARVTWAKLFVKKSFFRVEKQNE